MCLFWVVGVTVEDGVDGCLTHRHDDVGHGVWIEAGASRRNSSAVAPPLSTLSIEEPSVSETRLVVESGNWFLVAIAGREVGVGSGDDGSLLVDVSNVKVGRRMRPRMGVKVCDGLRANRLRAGCSTAGWDRMRIRGFARATRVEVCL